MKRQCYTNLHSIRCCKVPFSFCCRSCWTLTRDTKADASLNPVYACNSSAHHRCLDLRDLSPNIQASCSSIRTFCQTRSTASFQNILFRLGLSDTPFLRLHECTNADIDNLRRDDLTYFTTNSDRIPILSTLLLAV